MIEEIQRKVGELPDTPPVYVPSQDKEQPASSATEAPAAVEEPIAAAAVPADVEMEQAKASPSQASVSEEKVQEAVARPPTLENPDSQN